MLIAYKAIILCKLTRRRGGLLIQIEKVCLFWRNFLENVRPTRRLSKAHKASCEATNVRRFERRFENRFYENPTRFFPENDFAGKICRSKPFRLKHLRASCEASCERSTVRTTAKPERRALFP